jgi:hypothetical protein
LNHIRNAFHKYVPQQFHDPFGLLKRLVFSGDRAAWFAMETAVLGILTAPLDILLQVKEKQLYQQAGAPTLPLILVCGAPRSGTTLVSQVLINNLDIGYFNNLTSVFPRSPLVSYEMFRRQLNPTDVPYSSFYGKSIRFSGPNDALYLWDRWLGADRSKIRESLTEQEKTEMLHFFGACQEIYKKPILSKNNNLNVQANVVSDVLETAYFICMTRDPLYLAQSLLRARLDIHGDVNVAYGIDAPHPLNSRNHIEDVCRQVLFHERTIQKQQRLIGEDRFWIVQYEDFCRNPEFLVEMVSRKILDQPMQIDRLRKSIKPFLNTNKIKIEPEIFEEIASTIKRLRRTDQTTNKADGLYKDE